MSKKTMMCLDAERTGFEIYHDLLPVVVKMSTPELLNLAKYAMNQVVGMACTDELARRRPGR